MDKVFDFEILEKTGDGAFAEALARRGEIEQSGKYPFLMGGENSLRLLADSYKSNKDSAAEIIEKSNAIDVAGLFERLKNNSLPSAEETEFDIAHLTGKWEYRDSARELGLPWDDFIRSHRTLPAGKFLDKCFVGIVPTAESWQLPAYVKFGKWNTCPKPEEHCAVLRYWQEKHGAEIISLTGDVIECAVQSPPQTEAECWQLAWEQFGYCADIVHQGVGTIGELALSSRDAPYWYFWWD